MRCRRVRRLLPLHAGGDLRESHAADVTAHVRRCARCAATERALRASVEWVRGASHETDGILDGDFHEEVRRELRRRLQDAPHRSAGAPAPRLALALAVAALVVLGLALWPRRPDRPPAPAAQLAVYPPAPSPAPLTLSEDERPTRPPASRRRTPRRRASERLPGTRVTRIEFQTPDPHVRIIWLAKAS